jgi:ribonuclease G
MKKIIVSHKGGETCAAVLIDNELETFYNSDDNNPQLVGNIYKGRVQNFLPGMRAAFIEIGRDKNVFLQTNSPQKFSVGQSILIQIEKDAVGSKGARATLNISLAGRVLIFLPTLNYVGVSNKIRGVERERLHALAKKIRPEGTGLIVRTAAEGCDENILLDDLDGLQKLWKKISERHSKHKPPALLYNDNDLIERIIRDEFTADVEIIVDNLKIQRRFAELATDAKIIFYEGSAQIFESFGLAEEISNLNKRELPLPSGGQIVFDKTEALTAIDVNTGKFIGRTNFEETILKTNLEAAELILKQLKLRDMGGIIIVDFIDMESDAHKKILMNFLREQAQCDRNKTKIVDMTPLGLVEITRHSSRR